VLIGVFLRVRTEFLPGYANDPGVFDIHLVLMRAVYRLIIAAIDVSDLSDRVGMG